MEVFPKANTSSSVSPISSSSPHLDASPAEFAFLNHSQQTIPQNLPPSVDNKPLARQKRRRTSPEDAAILEAEFRRDSKPDKTERGRIAERVALGEKEVQIWFQNRRSTTRRRARPLTPPTSSNVDQRENGATLNLNNTPTIRLSDVESTLPSKLKEIDSNSGEAISFDESVFRRYKTTDEDTSQPSEHQEQGHSWMAASFSSVSLLPSGGSVNTQVLASGPRTDQTTTDSKAVDKGRSKTQEDENESSAQDIHVREADGCVAKSIASLPKKPFGVRLSMTSEGLATILGEDEASPSPPKLRADLEGIAISPRGLRRSYSAAGFSESFLSGRNSRTKSSFERSRSGRSRDSRAWEFWCDSEARNELAKKAEQESTGSAADAISLMRSTTRNALTPNQNKGNARDVRRQSLKRSKSMMVPSSKPSLGRATSSVARLQSGTHTNGGSLDNLKYHKPGMESVAIFESAGSDSDKENKAPFSNEANNAQYTNSASQRADGRRVLGESRTVVSQTRRTGLPKQVIHEAKRSDKLLHPDFEKNVAIDQEVAKFMTGECGSNASRQSDDLDCIQGLLSLSQGAWR